MPRGIIYQSKVAPVFVQAAETITVDKWYVRTSTPVFRSLPAALSIYVVAPVFPQPNDPGGVNVPGAAWPYQGYVEPLFTGQAAETITVDKWYQPASLPVRVQPPRHAFGVAITEPSLFVTPPGLGWAGDRIEPVRRPTRPITIGAYVTEPTLFAPPETITVDKWYQPASIPIPRPAPRNPGLSVAPLLPPLALDWQVPAVIPARHATRQAGWFCSPGITLPLEWNVTTPPLISRRHRTLAAGVSLIEPALFVNATIIQPPYYVEAAQFYAPGAAAGELNGGTVIAQTYLPGASAQFRATP